MIPLKRVRHLHCTSQSSAVCDGHCITPGCCHKCQVFCLTEQKEVCASWKSSGLSTLFKRWESRLKKKKAQRLGLTNGLKHFIKADFSDFATFSFVRQHLKFIKHDFICWCANSLPSCLKGRDTTFCSILWNTPPALPSWNVVFFHWGGHLFLQLEHSSAVWRLHCWWQRIKGGRR